MNQPEDHCHIFHSYEGLKSFIQRHSARDLIVKLQHQGIRVFILQDERVTVMQNIYLCMLHANIGFL